MTDVSLEVTTDRDVEPLLQRLTTRRFLHEQGTPERARAAAEDLLRTLTPKATRLRVTADERAVGEVWWVDLDQERAVVDVTLTDTGWGPAARRALEERAREEGAHRLQVTVSPGDAAAESLVADGGLEEIAVQMRLPLGEDLPPEPDLVLEPMDEATFAAWDAEEVKRYAEQRARAGESPELARRRAEEQHAALLPDGLATPEQHFFVGRVDEAEVGHLWLSTERPMVYVYDVGVDETLRRRGHGARLMRAGARWARDRGAHALGLNVFAWNTGARRLYEGLGYRASEVFLGKDL